MGEKLKRIGKVLLPFVAGPAVGIGVNVKRMQDRKKEHAIEKSDSLRRAQRRAVDDAAQPDPEAVAAVDRERQRRRLLRGRESTMVTPLGGTNSSASNPLKLIGQ